MSDSFQYQVKIELNPIITVGDISGNVGLSSLVLIFIFIIVLATRKKS